MMNNNSFNSQDPRSTVVAQSLSPATYSAGAYTATSIAPPPSLRYNENTSNNNMKQELNLQQQSYPPNNTNASDKQEPKILCQQQQQQPLDCYNKNNYQSPFVSNLDFLRDEDPNFMLTDSVIWGPETNEPTDELAPKPKPDRQDDPCGCAKPANICSLADDSPRNRTELMTCTDESCVLFACFEECRSNCPAGEYCGNKRIQRRQWKQLDVFHAEKKGKGLRILEDVKKGDFITEYVGKAVNKLFLNRLFRRYANERKLYIMALTTDVYLDARQVGGVARYINHSCDPNCTVDRWMVRGITRAAVVAKKDMKAGTELCFDYKWDRKRGRAPTKCHCGSKFCRQTLEVSRSMEDESMDRRLSQHWKKPMISRAGKEIINRCVRLFSDEAQEFYQADVVQYDENTGKHLLMYQHDLDEVWEDLKQENWMILDEEAEQFIIRRKNARNSNSSFGDSGSGGFLGASHTAGLLLQGQLQLHQGGVRSNYVYTQTLYKEALINRHLIERCQQSCRVTITPHQFMKDTINNEREHPEYEERSKFLQVSPDGCIWKLTIAGSDVPKARHILEKNIAYITNRSENRVVSALLVGDQSGSNVVDSTPSTSEPIGSADENSAEVVFPRSIVDTVKRRLLELRGLCRNVNITFVASESKSKQFAKLIVEGELVSDVDKAKEILWNHLNTACAEHKITRTVSGVFKDLGILGGSMSSSDFYRLLECDSGAISPASPSIGQPSSVTAATSSHGSNVGKRSSISPLNQDAKEDLTRWSPFFASFEAAQRCTVWVQSDSDKGQIDQNNRLIKQATPNAPRKLYFGCDPKIIPKLWRQVEARAADVGRGVKYFYLGPDRLYLNQMMQNNGQFFDFVRGISSASVSVDSMTGDHLRIDGRQRLHYNQADVINLSDDSTIGERTALAEELIQLQIELYRDHCIRNDSWIFGRDWTFTKRSVQKNLSKDSSNDDANMTASGTSRSPFNDTKALTNACFETRDIITSLDLDGNVAAHATIIMYRFITILSQLHSSETQLKMRELSLACIFIANKSQKSSKWRKLDAILSAAYKSYYPGVQFDASKEESLVWEEKVIAAESELLDKLNYDIFCVGFDWIIAAAGESRAIDREILINAKAFSVSGPILSVGPDLWLTYGEKYIFVACAAFLDAKFENLITVLSLIPIKVLQAAELIAESIKKTGFGKKSFMNNPALYQKGHKGLHDRIPTIKTTCAFLMSSKRLGGQMVMIPSERALRYNIIRDRNNERRVYHNVPMSLIKASIISCIDGMSAESKCNIFINKNHFSKSYDLILEGSWRSISIASYLLEEKTKVDSGNHYQLSNPEDTRVTSTSDHNKARAKGQPGLLQMNMVQDGWVSTIQSEVSNQAVWGRKTGGKCCVPGKVKESDLRRRGLRWWIPPRYAPSTNGSICDMFLVSEDDKIIDELKSLCRASQGETPKFAMLSKSLLPANGSPLVSRPNDRFVAVSLYRWPSEKVAAREESKANRLESKNEKVSKRTVSKVGFSPGALQEMQILRQLHGVINSAQGHPNLYLPIGVSLPSEEKDNVIDVLSSNRIKNSIGMKRIDEDIFSLTRTSLENEVAAIKEQERKNMVNDPHLVIQPTPFVLQRFVTKKRRGGKDEDKNFISPTIFATWCFDLLSAVLHCHDNGVILRGSLNLDQIVIDHSGIAKIGSLYKSSILSKGEKKLTKNKGLLELARQKKSEMNRRRKEHRKYGNDDQDDVLKDPYVPPEMLLGSPKYTKETDIWALGCLLSHLLLSKPIYSGKEKDRESLLFAMYKLVGIPAVDNFELGAKFPYYRKPEKKYKPGVEKAIPALMKENKGNEKAYTGAIDLIRKLLHLDPEKRINAKQALQHEYMSNFIEECNTHSFQENFAHDWISVKKRLMKTNHDEMMEWERGIKRKAMLMAASKSTTAEEDDLYDMGDVLGERKKSKQG